MSTVAVDVASRLNEDLGIYFLFRELIQTNLNRAHKEDTLKREFLLCASIQSLTNSDVFARDAAKQVSEEITALKKLAEGSDPLTTNEATIDACAKIIFNRIKKRRYDGRDQGVVANTIGYDSMIYGTYLDSQRMSLEGQRKKLNPNNTNFITSSHTDPKQNEVYKEFQVNTDLAFRIQKMIDKAINEGDWKEGPSALVHFKTEHSDKDYLI